MDKYLLVITIGYRMFLIRPFSFSLDSVRDTRCLLRKASLAYPEPRKKSIGYLNFFGGSENWKMRYEKCN